MPVTESSVSSVTILLKDGPGHVSQYMILFQPFSANKFVLLLLMLAAHKANSHIFHYLYT